MGGTQGWNRVRREPLATVGGRGGGEEGGVDRVSAEVARARDPGDLVSPIVQGLHLRAGATLYRTPGPSGNVTTNVDLVRKRSNSSTQLQGTPTLRTLASCRLPERGARGTGLRALKPGGGGAQSSRALGTNQVTRLAMGAAPPGSSHAQATAEWAERMSNQEGGPDGPRGPGACGADWRTRGEESRLQSCGGGKGGGNATHKPSASERTKHLHLFPQWPFRSVF